MQVERTSGLHATESRTKSFQAFFNALFFFSWVLETTGACFGLSVFTSSCADLQEIKYSDHFEY